MLVTLPHFLRLVPHPAIDDPLVGSVTSQIARKRMAKYVIPAKHLPPTVPQDELECIPRRLIFEFLPTVLGPVVPKAR